MKKKKYRRGPGEGNELAPTFSIRLGADQRRSLETIAKKRKTNLASLIRRAVEIAFVHGLAG